ncbi:hypothetical protein CGLAMM_11330 [Acetobacteraceae bacterium EV16G]|uniref:Uncharacterized protein n=1 Tax=Sorlinia euscelidii TaxID=3081148 RepID=A0ABU7U1X0_9PROT
MNLSDQFDYRFQILDGTFSAIIWFGSAQFFFFVVTSSNELSISLYKRLAQSKSPFFNSTKELAASVTAD